MGPGRHSKVKVKFAPEQAEKTQSKIQVQLYSFFNLGTRWGWVVNATPRRLYPRKETLCPFYKGLGGPQGLDGCRKLRSRRDSIPGPSSF